ncbi:MAG: hypothetical protein L6R38_008330 [Xanthoria sp. 2 TBL-2021]|nr:MAG: hypothetical protein L6R38_008330 [Xanthoria sp. 2 TBL-2021]
MSSASSEPAIYKLPFSQARFCYKSDPSADWTLLPSLQKDAWHNVVHANVGISGATIKQKFPQGAGTCTLEIPRDQISGAAVEILPYPGNDTSVFWVSFKVLSKPVCGFSRTIKGDQDPYSLKDFPLHYYSDSFHYLKLRLPRLKLSQKRGLTEEDYKKQLLRFTSQQPISSSMAAAGHEFKPQEETAQGTQENADKTPGRFGDRNYQRARTPTGSETQDLFDM